jgi:hypothetical protein
VLDFKVLDDYCDLDPLSPDNDRCYIDDDENDGPIKADIEFVRIDSRDNVQAFLTFCTGAAGARISETPS